MLGDTTLSAAPIGHAAITYMICHVVGVRILCTANYCDKTVALFSRRNGGAAIEVLEKVTDNILSVRERVKHWCAHFGYRAIPHVVEVVAEKRIEDEKRRAEHEMQMEANRETRAQKRAAKEALKTGIKRPRPAPRREALQAASDARKAAKQVKMINDALLRVEKANTREIKLRTRELRLAAGKKYDVQSGSRIVTGQREKAPWTENGSKPKDVRLEKPPKIRIEKTPQVIQEKQVKEPQHTIVTCPKCGAPGGGNAMLRWHFNNCTSRPHEEIQAEWKAKHLAKQLKREQNLEAKLQKQEERRQLKEQKMTLVKERSAEHRAKLSEAQTRHWADRKTVTEELKARIEALNNKDKEQEQVTKILRQQKITEAKILKKQFKIDERKRLNDAKHGGLPVKVSEREELLDLLFRERDQVENLTPHEAKIKSMLMLKLAASIPPRIIVRKLDDETRVAVMNRPTGLTYNKSNYA